MAPARTRRRQAEPFGASDGRDLAHEFCRLDSRSAERHPRRCLRARLRAARRRDSTPQAAYDIDCGRARRRLRSECTRRGCERRICHGRTRCESFAQRDGGVGGGQYRGRGASRSALNGIGGNVAYKFAFIMDPLEKVLIDKDTTFVFMLEAQFRGHEVYFLGLKDLYARGPQVIARARRCEVVRGVPHFRFHDDGAEYPIENFDAVFMRKDPPADANYLYATMLLSLADTRRTFFLNHPRGLREAI